MITLGNSNSNTEQFTMTIRLNANPYVFHDLVCSYLDCRVYFGERGCRLAIDY